MRANKLSAKNIVKGTIKKIKEGLVMAEIVLAIGDGGTISATISDESTKKLGLKEGKAKRLLLSSRLQAL